MELIIGGILFGLAAFCWIGIKVQDYEDDMQRNLGQSRDYFDKTDILFSKIFENQQKLCNEKIEELKKYI